MWQVFHGSNPHILCCSTHKCIEDICIYNAKFIRRGGETMCTVTMTGELKTTLNKTFKQLNPKPVNIPDSDSYSGLGPPVVLWSYCSFAYLYKNWIKNGKSSWLVCDVTHYSDDLSLPVLYWSVPVSGRSHISLYVGLNCFCLFFLWRFGWSLVNDIMGSDL